jgi:transposase
VGEKYRAGAADGFGYSWFCDPYRAWAGRLKPTMRQVHVAGEKLFVDFAGRMKAPGQKSLTEAAGAGG